MPALLPLALVASVVIPAAALGLTILFCGLRLSWRSYGVLLLQLWLLLLLAGGSFGWFASWARLAEAGVRGYLRYGSYWVGALTLASGILGWIQLRRLGQCSRWRATCGALLLALTITAILLGCVYFAVQAGLPLRPGSDADQPYGY